MPDPFEIGKVIEEVGLAVGGKGADASQSLLEATMPLSKNLTAVSEVSTPSTGYISLGGPLPEGVDDYLKSKGIDAASIKTINVADMPDPIDCVANEPYWTGLSGDASTAGKGHLPPISIDWGGPSSQAEWDAAASPTIQKYIADKMARGESISLGGPEPGTWTRVPNTKQSIEGQA